jgi:hypothetical protein
VAAVSPKVPEAMPRSPFLEPVGTTAANQNCSDRKRRPEADKQAATERRQLANLRRAIDANPPEKTKARLESALACRRDATIFRLADRTLAFAPLTCDRKWCPACCRKWSAELTARTLTACEEAGALHSGGLRHLVLTIPNARAGELSQRIQQLGKAFRLWLDYGRRARRKKAKPYLADLEGHTAKLEIDWSPKRGWHPHLHALIDLGDSSGFLDFRADSEARLSWCARTEALGAAANQAGQWISKPTTRTKAAAEVAKYAAKPFQILKLPPERLHEIADATHGVRFVRSSGSLALPEKAKSHGAERVCEMSELWTKPHAAITESERADLIARYLAALQPYEIERLPPTVRRAFLETQP